MKTVVTLLASYAKKQLGLLLAFFALSLVLLSLTRLGIVLLELERAQASHNLAFIFVQGFRFDLITTCLFGLIGYLVMFALSWNLRGWQISQMFLRFYFAASILLMLFMELSTPSFIQQFDIRPNYLFVEYLDSPHEVLNTLVKAYPIQLILAAILLPLTYIFIIKVFRRLNNFDKPNCFAHFALAPLILFLFAFGIRSTFSHRPVNPSVVAITADPMVNSLALNSTYSLFYAIYSAKKHEQGASGYGSMDRAKIMAIIKNTIPAKNFPLAEIPTLHLSSPKTWKGSKPKNLVIVLQESLGAEFVGSLGGLPLTPNIDKLKTDGIWFDQMYATGTRSARGIEAVITGFPPTPAQSVLKLPKSQTNFFTVASLLKRYDYETSFIYGGEAHFDNMRNFFVGNGFTKIIEQKDYENPKFVGSWGVSDEDLFIKANQYFSSLGDKPFFSLVFSSSNHTPFEYPEGVIDPYDGEFHTVNNAVKYADYAFGTFVEMARKSSYWNDTVFLLVADHNSRVYGQELIPIDRFHIPAAIFGGGIAPNTVSKVTSQIDLIPTLLPLMGIQDEIPSIGLDVLSERAQALPGRAMFQFNALQGYMENNDVVVLQNNLEPSQYTYKDGHLTAVANTDTHLSQKALAHALWASMTYSENLYSLPEKTMERKP